MRLVYLKKPTEKANRIDTYWPITCQTKPVSVAKPHSNRAKNIHNVHTFFALYVPD